MQTNPPRYPLRKPPPAAGEVWRLVDPAFWQHAGGKGDLVRVVEADRAEVRYRYGTGSVAACSGVMPTWEFLKRHELFPMVESSAIFMALVPPEWDVKSAVELGAAILMDKPILAVGLPGRQVSGHLRRVADVVVEDCDLYSKEGKARLQEALTQMVELAAKGEQ